MDIARDGWREPRQGLQIRYVVGICQEANIEDQIGIDREAVLKAERLYGDLELRSASFVRDIRKRPAQFRGGQAGAVYHFVRAPSNIVQQGALRLNRFQDAAPSLAEYRVRPACLFEPAYQHIVARVQKENLNVRLLIRQKVQYSRQL